MARVRARAPHFLLRIVLLLVGIGLVLGVVVLLMAQRFAATTEDLVTARGGDAEIGGDEVVRGRGFSFTATVEQQKLFTISAERIRQDKSDRAFLEGVLVEIYRPGDEVVLVTSDEADYNPKSMDAELRGHVELRSRDLELDTRSLQLVEKGQVLISPEDVALRYPPDLEGRASVLRVDLRQDRYVLSQGVHLRSTASAPMRFRLDSETLHHDRDQGVIRAVGGVRLERGQDLIQTENLTALFENDMADLRTVRARIDVRGTFRLDEPPLPRRIEVRGKVLVAQFELASGHAERVELDAEDGATATLSMIDESGLGYSFVGQRLRATLLGGEPQQIEGFGNALRLTELIDGPEPVVLRRACANRVDARFAPGGVLDRVRLETAVELEDGDVSLSGGDVADLDWRGGRVDIRGTAVRLFSRRGDVIAPRFVYQRERGLVSADGGVRATLTEDSARMLGTTPLGTGDGPVMVESSRAEWVLEPASFTFLGAVRAWRGANLILAEQLRGDGEGKQLTATGSPLKTIWVPQPSPDAPAAASGPIQVTAQQLSYTDGQRHLIYTGDVDAVQGQNRLRCRKLDVELESHGGRAERMRCERDVTLVDTANGREIEGQLAIYDLARNQVEVVGERVVVREANGNAFTCRYLIYDLATGGVTVKSQPPPGAPTIPAAASAVDQEPRDE